MIMFAELSERLGMQRVLCILTFMNACSEDVFVCLCTTS